MSEELSTHLSDSKDATVLNASIGEHELIGKESIDESVLFAVSRRPIAAKPLTGAEQEAIEDEIQLRERNKRNNLERIKRQAAEVVAMLLPDDGGSLFFPEFASAMLDNSRKASETYGANADYIMRVEGTLPPYKADGSQRTAYVAGPMTGLTLCNFPAFDAARDDLNARGFKAITPADIDREVGFDPSVGTPDEFDLQAAIRRDVEAILNCDAVILLPGHQASKGATAERCVAEWAGIPCYTYPDLKRYEHRD